MSRPERELRRIRSQMKNRRYLAARPGRNGRFTDGRIIANHNPQDRGFGGREPIEWNRYLNTNFIVRRLDESLPK